MTANEKAEHAALMLRLRAIASPSMAARYEGASIEAARRVVDAGEAQLKRHADAGFEDMAAGA